ncbi:MAG: hypothetical protein WA055_00900 [Candidatus Moraniibacteriota bacterium]
MSQQTHIKTNPRKILLAIIFILVIGFGFGKGEKAKAEEPLGDCFERVDVINTPLGENVTQAKCQDLCKAKNVASDNCAFDDNSDSNIGLGNYNSASTTLNPSPDSCTLPEFSKNIMNCTLLMLLNLMVWLMESAASLFEWIMKPENVTAVINNNSVYNAWTMVRDVLNVSFIMFLLFSAFATVFQVDKYNYKKTLLWIVIMALLVNFSFPISRFIIDVSNVMMFYFADALGINGARTMVDFAGAAKLPEIIHNEIGSFDSTYLLAAVIFVFIFAVTIVTITVLFVLRTIALAILIIFSSLAFVGAAIPQLSSYASDWWKKLFNYAFFGPIMLFMMYIASGMMTEIGKSGMGSMQKIAASQTDNPDFIASISFFTIPIVILWMGIGVAQSMSAVGAGAVVGQGKKVMNWPVRAGKWGGSTLLKKTDRGLAKSKYMWWASPTAFKTAWKENTAEKERKAFKIATGSWRDKLNKISGEQTNFKDTAIQGNIATKEKELQSTSTDFRYLYNEYKKARSAGDHEKMSATLRIIASNNDLNDFMQEEGDTMDPTNVRERIYAQLTKSGMSKEQAAKQLADIGEISFGKGNFQLFGMGKFNIKTGKYQKNEDIDLDPATGADSGQFAMAAGKASNIKAQTKTDLWHWNSFLQQNADGTTGNIHGIGFKQLESLTPSELGQLNRARKDFFDRMSQKIPEMRTHANSIRTANPTQAGIIDEFIRRVDGFKNDPNFKP